MKLAVSLSKTRFRANALEAGCEHVTGGVDEVVALAEGARGGEVKQPTLFDIYKPPMPCSFGTPWLDHWQPPIGTGKGCEQCDDYQRDPKKHV